MEKGDIVKPAYGRVSSNYIKVANIVKAKVLKNPCKNNYDDRKKMVALEILSTKGDITEIDGYLVRSLNGITAPRKEYYKAGDTIIVYEDCLFVISKAQETQDVSQVVADKEFAPSTNYSNALKCLFLKK